MNVHPLDAADPLAPLRERFYLPAEAPVYLDGNSLGLLSRDAEASVRRVLEEWKTLAIGGWLDGAPPWFTLAETLAARVARFVGAGAAEVAVTNSTTVNLHQLLATLYRPDPARPRIVAYGGEFPSDLYAIKSHLRLRGVDPAAGLVVVPPGPDRLLDRGALDRALDDPAVQMAVLPAVVYTTGELLDLRAITAQAHAWGVCVGFDLSHSVGVVPHRLAEDGVDFAFWCHYKYLNAGPGAVGGLFLHARHAALLPGLAGWWGSNKTAQFNMSSELHPASGAGGLQVGTPPILGLAALEGALDIAEEAGIEPIRKKSLALTAYLTMLLCAPQLAVHGFGFANPAEGSRRGGHVALVHPEAARICRALKDAGVVTDYRPPDIVRFAPVPLYNTFADCEAAAAKLGEIMAARAYENYPTLREALLWLPSMTSPARCTKPCRRGRATRPSTTG